MAVPDRSTLPPEMVTFLTENDAYIEAKYARSPVLPASETPQVLIDAAAELNATIARHLSDDSDASRYMEHALRPHIEAVLRREVTEPVSRDDMRIDRRLYDSDIIEKRRDLESAWSTFVDLISGHDHSTEDAKDLFRWAVVGQRKTKAERLGLELDLTDEEWWQL